MKEIKDYDKDEKTTRNTRNQRNEEIEEMKGKDKQPGLTSGYKRFPLPISNSFLFGDLNSWLNRLIP